MREIFYAIYKNSTYEIMLLTSIAENYYYNRIKFINNRIKLNSGFKFNKYEKQILSKLLLNNNSYFHLSDYHKWIDSLKNECYNNGYIRKVTIFNLRTKLFKKLIKNNIENGFNNDIINFINTKNKNILNFINKDIIKIKLPYFKINNKNKYNFNIDSLDVINEATDNNFGRFRRP